MKWYSMKGPGGTITCKGHFPNEAKAEATERWSCDADEIEITGDEEYNKTAPGMLPHPERREE